MFDELVYILDKFRMYETNLEIKGCMGNSNSLDKIAYFIKDLIVHGCQLTYKEFASIMPTPRKCEYDTMPHTREKVF